MNAWEVPGYQVLELLGYGQTGEVWRARTSSGLVALRRLAGVDHDAVAAVRRQATVVRSLPTDHLIRLRCVTRAQGDDVLVLDHADGGSLEAVLASRGTLTPGEVVTVLAPLAEALGQAHAHELCHRRVEASRVLLSGDGRPLLDGLGLEPVYDLTQSLDPTGALGPMADVWGLGALGFRMLTGQDPAPGTTLAALAPTAPVPLVVAIEAALHPDPTARPSAEALAAALLAACPALPLTGLGVRAVLPPRPAARRRRPPRSALVSAAALAVLLVVVLLGWTWGARSTPATASAPPVRVTAPATDWIAVVVGLDAARSRAFARGDAQALGPLYATSSPDLALDRAALATLTARGARARGLTHRVLSATAIGTSPEQVTLKVSEQLSAYQLIDARGVVLERHTAGPPVTAVMSLLRRGSGWCVGVVRAGP